MPARGLLPMTGGRRADGALDLEPERRLPSLSPQGGAPAEPEGGGGTPDRGRRAEGVRGRGRGHEHPADSGELGSNLGARVAGCVALGQPPSFSGPQFPHP